MHELQWRQVYLGGDGHVHAGTWIIIRPLHTSFKLTPLLRTSSMSRKVELFASTLRDSLWLHSSKVACESAMANAVT